MSMQEIFYVYDIYIYHSNLNYIYIYIKLRENESEMWGITDKCNAALLLIKEEFTTFVIKKRPSLIISNLPMLYSSEISPRCPYISEGECTPIDQRFRASSFNPKDEFPNNNGLPLITEPDLEISHIDCDGNIYILNNNI